VTNPDIQRSWASIRDALRNLPDVRNELDIQPNEEARQGLLDLMGGLAFLSEAAAAFARGDHITGHEHLDRSHYYAVRGHAAASGRDPDTVD